MSIARNGDVEIYYETEWYQPPAELKPSLKNQAMRFPGRGVNVRRFANARTRDLDSFNRFSDWIFNYPHTREDELRWLEEQGVSGGDLLARLQLPRGGRARGAGTGCCKGSSSFYPFAACGSFFAFFFVFFFY